jgi:hypothetical protein
MPSQRKDAKKTQGRRVKQVMDILQRTVALSRKSLRFVCVFAPLRLCVENNSVEELFYS